MCYGLTVIFCRNVIRRVKNGPIRNDDIDAYVLYRFLDNNLMYNLVENSGNCEDNACLVFKE